MFDPTLNVEPFFNSPFGLDYEAKKHPVSGVALMVHKLMEGETLDDTHISVSICVDPLNPSSGLMEFTEQGFLEYLQTQNRAFPCTPGVRPKSVVIFAGRRAGKTNLLHNKAIYDSAMALAASNHHQILGTRTSADFLYTSFSPDMSRIMKQNADKTLSNTWLGSKLSTMTNSSMYFEDQNTSKKVRLLFRGGRSCRGVNPFSWYADEFDYHQSFEGLSKALLPCLHSEGSQHIFVGSGQVNPGKDMAANFFNLTRDNPDCLGLVLHSWELHPRIPYDFLHAEFKRHGNLQPYMAFTPRRP